MNQEQWTAVEQYISELLVGSDEILEGVLRASVQGGLPPINVSPNEGKLLHLLARIRGARNILEIGTLGGYSTIWLARAVPRDGRMITLVFNPTHAAVARANLAAAGLADVVELIEGRAIETLPRLAAAGRGPFDMIFIDADKPSTVDYFDWALKLSRPGSVIVVDNVVRKGAIVDPANHHPDVEGIRRFNQRLAAEKRVSATAIQTVGSKGYDGFAMVVVA